MRKLLLLVFALVFVGLTGCASKLMQPADHAAVTAQPGQDEVTVVFFRATSFGGAVQAFVCEEVDGELKFIAIVSSGMKVAHKTKPGKHVYMTGAESSELMYAELEGGKTYYAYVSPQMGMWKAGFAFVPVTDKDLQTDSLKSDLAWCEWHENKPEAQQWFRDNYDSLKAKYAEARQANKKMMLPQYGSDVPLK